MLVRILYAAVAISVLGALPRAVGDRSSGARGAATERSFQDAWLPREAPAGRRAAGGGRAIECNPADFANPRIDR